MQRVFQLPRLLIKKATVSGRRFRKETMRSVNYEEKHSHQALSYHLFVISTRTFSHSVHRRLAVYEFTNRSFISPASPPRSCTSSEPCSPGRNSARNRTPAASPARHNTERQMNWCTDWCKIIFRPFPSLHYSGRSDHSGGNVLLISTVGLVGNGPHKPP